MWKAQVLDVEAQEADRQLFAVLHETTARRALPFFVAKLEGFAAQDLSEAYVAEAQALKQFLSAETQLDTLSHGELGPAMAQLKAELEEFIRKPLSQAEAEAGDLALAKDLSLEFAGSLWATIISTLRQQTSEGEFIPSSALLPVPDKVLEHCRHFELQAPELNEVMAAVLGELAESRLVSNDTLYLPGRLKIDRSLLLQHLRASGNSQHKGLFIADVLGMQWHRIRDMLK